MLVCNVSVFMYDDEYDDGVNVALQESRKKIKNKEKVIVCCASNCCVFS